MKELTPQEAHTSYIANRKKRVDEIVSGQLEDRELAERKKKALVEGVEAMAIKRRKKPIFSEPEAAGTAAAVQTLPEGWRDAHWKTIVKLAEDTLGEDFSDKDSAVAALEDYENGN